MSQKYEKLKTLLKELFQLDQPDLDFGLYRIMHAKSAEVTQFLDKDLLPQVKEAFGLYQHRRQGRDWRRSWPRRSSRRRRWASTPRHSPKVKELRAKLASDAVDMGALENEVYDHLFSFFRRYYSEGDFLAKRVYKPGVYAIPYEGEEVKLHWANTRPVLHQDQRVPARLCLPPAAGRRQEADARALPAGGRRRGRARQRQGRSRARTASSFSAGESPTSSPRKTASWLASASNTARRRSPTGPRMYARARRSRRRRRTCSAASLAEAQMLSGDRCLTRRMDRGAG